MRMIFSLRSAMTVLAIHVGNIFQVRAKKQMRWLNALGVVASVKNVLPSWNFPMADLPTHSMGFSWPIANGYLAIPGVVKRCGPLQTASDRVSLYLLSKAHHIFCIHGSIIPRGGSNAS
jgi:hypothetical protein